MHRREHIKCLSESFHVIVIDEDCDYDQICDKFQPNLTLFESGLNLPHSRRLSITNRCTHPAIPKLGFINADAWCETRAGTISEMDQWGIDTFFSISATAAEHTPEIADNLFVWPPFIDTDTYRDYGERKLIPIMLTGSQDPQYPWRRRVYKSISENYPSFLCPHRGYLSRAAQLQVLYGENYARTINASFFAPACGTVAKEVVRKHFEIPGCKACLITEASSSLTAAGFVDMENCVFADGSNILDKLEHLFRNPDQLHRITEAGHELVHSRHTIRHRNQLLQWYVLNSNLEPHQKIVQLNPFERLAIAEPSSGLRHSAIASNGLHLTLLREGDIALWVGHFEEATALYRRCLNYMRRLPEARLRLALCSLYQGQAKNALVWAWEPIEYILAEYRAIDPDPIEWAYYIISLLCLGHLRTASKRSAEFPWLHHPELDRVRWVVNVLTGSRKSSLSPSDFQAGYRASIHQLPERSAQSWIDELYKMLRACGQSHLVSILEASVTPESLSSLDTHSALQPERRSPSRGVTPEYQRVSGRDLACHIGSSAAVWRRSRFLGHRIGRKVNNYAIEALRHVKRTLACFSPHATSATESDDLYQAIQRLTREESIKTLVMIGVPCRSQVDRALTSVLAAKDGPSVFCISWARHIPRNRWNSVLSRPMVKLYRLSSWPPERLSEDLADSLTSIKRDNQLDMFDALVIQGSGIKDNVAISNVLSNIVGTARFVALGAINENLSCAIYHKLLQNPGYDLIDYNLQPSSEYAIFKKQNGVDVEKCSGLVLSPTAGVEQSSKE
jgi:hypothetical protein